MPAHTLRLLFYVIKLQEL